jgi:pimeloyl-ACP methyl ester carboxylesterase
MIESNGHTIDFTDTGGDGPVLLFLPGSYSTPAAWRPVQRLLSPGLRMVTTSLCGYGKSAETRSALDPGIHHEVALVKAVARQVGQPVHLVGHSFGGTVALATALSRTIPVASLSLFEANPLDLVCETAGGSLYQSTLDMSRAFEAAVEAREHDAPARIIDFWGGPGAFAAMPLPVQAYCRETARVNVLDWHGDFGFAVRAADCASLDLPVLLVRGALANDTMKAITGQLQGAISKSRTEVVDGAGHFLISSHPQMCAQILSSFIDEVVHQGSRHGSPAGA